METKATKTSKAKTAAKQNTETSTKSTRTKTVDRIFQLTDSRSGEAFLLKTGRNRKLSIYDDALNLRRAIRHCPNERSIFIDEQSEQALVEPIIFEKGVLEVRAEDVMTQIFLDTHPDNVINGGGWFEEIDENADAKEEIELEDLILDIKSEIRNRAKAKDGSALLEMAVGVLTGDLNKAAEMSEEACKRLLYLEAERNPNYFLDEKDEVNIFDDHEVIRKYMVLSALRSGVIVKTINLRSIAWASSKEVIATAPRGTNLIDYFADFLATDEGILVLEEIKKRS